MNHNRNVSTVIVYLQIHRDHVISAITWLKEHNSHYADIILNDHWYSDIASREMSVQLDENDNHITVTENAILNKSLQNENMSKEKLNKDNNPQLLSRQIESTNV